MHVDNQRGVIAFGKQPLTTQEGYNNGDGQLSNISIRKTAEPDDQVHVAENMKHSEKTWILSAIIIIIHLRFYMTSLIFSVTLHFCSISGEKVLERKFKF